MPHHEGPSASEAAIALGQMALDRGDIPAAIESFRMAARDGHPMGLTMLGRLHERGWGVAPDPVQAAAWFRRAADQSEPWAMFNLADLHLSGRGLPRDAAQARAWYLAAAQKGLPQALNMLGRLAGAADEAEAWFRAGAQAGDPWAMFNLTRLLLAESQTSEALFWLDRAIAHGFAALWRAILPFLDAHPLPALRRRAAMVRARLTPGHEDHSC